MRSGQPAAPRPFTPSREDPAELDRRTVGRTDILATLAERLTTVATSRSRPHTLLVGPRGSGKSHLLRVALHRLDQRPDVRDRLAVADVGEDAVGITRYTDLLWEIGTSLGWQLPRSSSVVDLEETVLNGIGDKTLVVVIENLDRVFKSIGHSGQQNLRSWVETSGRILLVAATPALFAGVADRNEPWFAGMITTPVDGLSAESGLELLTFLARERGDDALANFLQTDVGQARVQAVAQLTGGSARIWMVLSECLTIDSLDALIPAVEALIEGLVPYYQQLLWDLPGNHQAVVRQLAEGPAAALTVSDIAGATGLSQQTVSKALTLLTDGRWVRAEKIEGADSRKTWYSLREPMLRHHFQWRNTRGEPLLLIVELLRAWYQLPELRRQLADADPRSRTESYLLHSLSEHPSMLDDAYADRDIRQLVADARRWIAGDSDVFTVDCGRYVEACVALTENPALGAATLLQGRGPDSDSDLHVARALSRSSKRDLASLLIAAAEAAPPSTRAGISIVAAGWIGSDDAARAHALLAAVPLKQIDRAATVAAVQLEANDWLSETGLVEEARKATVDMLPRLEALGADHPVTLSARATLLTHEAEADDLPTMIEAAQTLVADMTRVLGPDRQDTLLARYDLARYVGESGDYNAAIDLFAELLRDETRLLGTDHLYALTTRAEIAYFTGEAGNPDTALSLYRELQDDELRALGPDHPNTLVTRAQIAYYVASTKDPAAALRLYEELLPDRLRVLGPNHRNTLTTRQQIAYCTAETGDIDSAIAMFSDLIPDLERVLGPDDKQTLTTRSLLADYIVTRGDHGTARVMYRDLLADRRRVDGANHPDVLTTFKNMLACMAWTGAVDEAVAMSLNDPLGAGTTVDLLMIAPTPPTQPRLLNGMWRAFRGDPEALAELPAELRDVAITVGDRLRSRPE